jgi:hypothetical protein
LTLRKSERRDSSVCIATFYGLDDRMIGVRFPAVARDFYRRHRVQTGGSFPKGETAGA